MPSPPPTMPSVPNVPLCTFRARRARARAAAPRRAPASRADGRARPWTASASRPRSCTETSPQRSTPSPVSKPGFSAMNVAVAAARIAGRARLPVSASRPRGHVEGEDRRRQRIGRSRPSPRSRRGSGRARPMPNSPSTTSAPRQPAGMSAIVSARGDEGAIRGRRVGGQPRRIAAKHHGHVEESRRAAAARRRTRRRRCCRAPRAPERTRRARRPWPCDVRRRPPGALHQRRASCRRLDGAQLVRAVDRAAARATGPCRDYRPRVHAGRGRARPGDADGFTWTNRRGRR